MQVSLKKKESFYGVNCLNVNAIKSKDRKSASTINNAISCSS